MLKNKENITKKEQELLDFLIKNGATTPKNIYPALKITKQRLFVILSGAIKKSLVEKRGSTPSVYYFVNTKIDSNNPLFNPPGDNIAKAVFQILKDNFYIVSPVGNVSYGYSAFVEWCDKRKIDKTKSVGEYVNIVNKYKKNVDLKTGLIDATKKIKDSFMDAVVKKMYYVDFYSYEIFGRTKLGQLMMYAKKSQNEQLSIEIIKMVGDRVTSFIKKERFDAVCYVPPTESRSIQFMRVLERELSLQMPKIEVAKIKTSITVPQKTLSKIEDRIINARETMFIKTEGVKYKKVLIIDDAVGSGATFNEIAKKIYQKNICKNIYTLGIVGSPNGFEVIKDV